MSNSAEPCPACCCFHTCPWSTEKKIDKGAVPCKTCGCRWCGGQATREQAYDQAVRDMCAMLRREHAAGSFGSFDFAARCIEQAFKGEP